MLTRVFGGNHDRNQRNRTPSSGEGRKSLWLHVKGSIGRCRNPLRGFGSSGRCAASFTDYPLFALGRLLFRAELTAILPLAAQQSLVRLLSAQLSRRAGDVIQTQTVRAFVAVAGHWLFGFAGRRFVVGKGRAVGDCSGNNSALVTAPDATGQRAFFTGTARRMTVEDLNGAKQAEKLKNQQRPLWELNGAKLTEKLKRSGVPFVSV